MLPVERALLVINRTAGTGLPETVVEELTSVFRQGLDGLSEVNVELVGDHAPARACVAAFVSASDAPALIVAGGGGGTLRAVIEGICDACDSAELPGPQRVRIAALRMGSGNVLARQFGVPRDPVVALRDLLVNLKAGRIASCCVMRCETWTKSRSPLVHHAVTLGGLGQFGRIPPDLARWHARLPFVHKTAASLGIEKFTNVEYALTFFIRFVGCLLLPDRTETVEVQFQDRREQFRLFSGVVMNFPIKALPFNPGVTVEDEALSVRLFPFRARWSHLHLRIEKDQRLEIRFVDRERVEFFLDEDPVTTYGKLTFAVAGSIAFVPGSALSGSHY